MIRIALGLGSLLLLATGTAHAQTRELATRGVLLDRIAAVVNNGVVLKSELDDQVEQITQRLQAQRMELPPENVLRQQILERLVDQEIQLQRAEKMGMQIPDEMLNEQLKALAERNKIPLDQLPDVMKAQGMDYAAYRESLRREMTVAALRQRDLRIVVTPREIDQYLAKQSSSLANEEFDVSHILISVPAAATPDQVQEAEGRAQEIYGRANKGEDFAQLAVSYSNSQTALEGGKLGWRKGPQLPGFIAELVAKMKPGEVAGPVRTPSGFHLLRLNDRRSKEQQVIANQVHARHILMKTNEVEDDETVRQKLLALRQRILNGEDFAGLAATTSEDPVSAVEGGDLGWTGEGTFVPEFEKALASLDEKQISEPFHTQYGWHIVQLLGRRTQDVTDEKRRQQAYVALRESKADEEMELWLQRLRDGAYIEYKM